MIKLRCRLGYEVKVLNSRCIGGGEYCVSRRWCWRREDMRVSVAVGRGLRVDGGRSERREKGGRE